MRGIAEWQWIFQRNDGPTEVSVAIHEGRAYRRRIDSHGHASYATAPRVDAPESDWMACDENGVARRVVPVPALARLADAPKSLLARMLLARAHDALMAEAGDDEPTLVTRGAPRLDDPDLPDVARPRVGAP